MTRTMVGVAAAVSVVLLLVGCESAGEPAGGAAVKRGLVWGTCPDQIAITLTARHRCGTLTVPVRHDSPDGRTLTLDVIEAWPASDEDATDLAASVGFNFGEPAHDPGSMAALAERLGVAVVGLAPRGVGGAGGIALDCPELDGFGATQISQPDAAGHQAFLTAVRDCRERLADAKVDPSAFALDDLVADLEALRSALGIDRWHALVTYGELARLSDAYLASYQGRVRAVVKDSPPPAGRDSFALAPEGTRSALAALFGECQDDPPCSARYPELARAWQQALRRADARPLHGSTPGGEILVDAPKLLRAVRAMLGGDGPAYVKDLPRVITAAADGDIHPTLAAVVAADPGYCNGYRPLCTKPGFSMGAYLSQACPEMGPGNKDDERNPLYREVFRKSPYIDACTIWDVDASPAPAASTETPTLVLNGDLDSWSRPEWTNGAVAVRGATHDVTGSSTCVLEIRNTWITNPRAEPETAPCSSSPYPNWD